MAEQHTDSMVSAPVGAVVFLILLSATLVALRLYTRIYTKQSLRVDDYFAIASFCVIFGTGVAIGTMTEVGLGKHTDDVSRENLLIHKQGRFVATVLYAVGLLTTKTTFLLQYLKVLEEWRTYRKFLASSLLILLLAMSEFWVNLFICIPVSGIWDSSIRSSCIPNEPYQYVYISVDIISALAIFLFPIMFMRYIVIGWPEAIVLAVVYTFGLFVLVLQFVRFHYVQLGDDFTWKFADRASLMMTELAVALLCACVPLLHPLAKGFFPHQFCTCNFDKGDKRPIKTPWPGEMEENQYAQQHGIHGTPDAKIMGFGAGPGYQAGLKQKNQNHTPRDGPENIRPLPRRDDSGDLSDEIIGLKSARKGLKRISFTRSLSDSDIKKPSPKRRSKGNARESPRPGISRTRTSPHSQSPTLGFYRHECPEPASMSRTVMAQPHSSLKQANKPSLAVVEPSHRSQSFEFGNGRMVLRKQAMTQQQQNCHQQQQQNRHSHDHHTTLNRPRHNDRTPPNQNFSHNSFCTQTNSSNKPLPEPQSHVVGGAGLYDTKHMA